LTISDVDTGEAKFDPSSVTNTTDGGALGSLSITEAGTWTYTVDNAAVQYLGAGDTKVETFTVKSLDGTGTQTISVTITGTNDVPTVTGLATGSVTEDVDVVPCVVNTGYFDDGIYVGGLLLLFDGIQTTGKLTATDVDAGESSFQAVVKSTNHGWIKITESGAWTYMVDNGRAEIQSLGVGETLTDTVTVRTIDGTAHTLTLTINGTGDFPLIGGDADGSVTEDAANPKLTDSGVLTISDVDAGEAKFDPDSVEDTTADGALGSLTITEAGTWTYTVDNAAVQYLGAGKTKVETFTVKSLDGTGTQTISVTVNGVNDAATFSGADTGSVNKGTSETATGALIVSDVDTGEATMQSGSYVGQYGTLVMAANGEWTYTLDSSDPDVQALGAGGTLTDTVTVRSADGTEHAISLIIHGKNDPATFSGDDTGSVIEDTTVTATGTLVVTDVNTGEDHMQAETKSATYGTLVMATSGEWTYTLDHAKADSLTEGQVVSDKITVKSADGTTHIVAIKITGTNDMPIIGGDATGAVTEDAANPTLTTAAF
jgi:large repetitive protein